MSVKGTCAVHANKNAEIDAGPLRGLGLAVRAVLILGFVQENLEEFLLFFFS